MPLRALRLLQTAEATVSLSFSATLQLAAGRAWSRRVLAHGHPSGVKRGVKTHAHWQIVYNDWDELGQNPYPPTKDLRRMTRSTLGNEARGPSSSQHTANTERRTVGVSYFDPQSGEYEPTDADMVCMEDDWDAWVFPQVTPVNPPSDAYERSAAAMPRIEDDSSASVGDIPSELSHRLLHPVSSLPIEPIPHSLPPTPTSRLSLYRNLVYVLNARKPILRLPALLDYYALYPHLHSTASHNLLISVCLRHRALGIVRSLFKSLRESDLPKNTTTYKLEIRWLNLLGQWNHAWDYIQSLKYYGKFSKGPDGLAEIPYELWLEFCRVPKRRRLLRIVRKKNGKEAWRVYEGVETTPEELVARQRLLYEHRPSTVPPLAETRPFAVLCLVQLLVQSGKREQAWSLIRAYLKSIPKEIDAKNRRSCLAIIHAYIVTTPEKKPLPAFYETRRSLGKLLKEHQRLQPDSKTLLLLMNPLQRAKAAGSIAWDALRWFKSSWGPQVEDRRVRRRVANLALKEGRMDLVQNMIQAEESDAEDRRQTLLEQRVADVISLVPSRWRRRSPFRAVYPGNGRESRFWSQLKARIRRKGYRETG